MVTRGVAREAQTRHSRRMGKTAKRQNKRAAAMLGAKGGTSAKKTSAASVSAAALGDALGMQTDDAAGVNI